MDAEDATSSTGEPVGGDKPGRFDKAKLMTDVAAFPGRPVLWNVLKKTRSVDDESEEIVTEWTTGRVVKWQTRENAPTKWVVHYTDGEKRAFALEELVDEIEASITQGLDVMNRQASS